MTGIPHRFVAKALEQLAGDMLIADDGPHVAVVIGVNAEGPPTIWFANREGDTDPVARLIFDRQEAEEKQRTRSSRPMPFTWADITNASEYLKDFLTAVCARSEHPLQDADQRHAKRVEVLFDRVLEADAYRLANPHACDGCGRRFATEPGLATHRRQCIRGKAGHTEAARQSSALGATGIRCTCGEHVWADTWHEAKRLMRSHIDAVTTDDSTSPQKADT